MHSNSDESSDAETVVNDKNTQPGRLAKLFKRSSPTIEEPAETQNSEHPSAPQTVEQGLEKSRGGLLTKIAHVFKSSFDLDDELFEELEEVLISSDIGVQASSKLVEQLREKVAKEKIQDADGVLHGLHEVISEQLAEVEQSWAIEHEQTRSKPYVLLIVGVNGVGKTTTTAKIAQHFSQQGKSVMLAAADTFRAAAVEQLQEWGKRLNVPVIAQQHGADAAAVAHDALRAAIARDTDILIIDTAGRLHTQTDLMQQLQKVLRVLAKIDPDCPHEVMQILDAGTGQNALSQLEHFKQAVNVSSLTLTKLDGSAKGGVMLALAEKFSLPVRFIGVGEGAGDLKRFNAREFANGLIATS